MYFHYFTLNLSKIKEIVFLSAVFVAQRCPEQCPVLLCTFPRQNSAQSYVALSRVRTVPSLTLHFPTSEQCPVLLCTFPRITCYKIMYKQICTVLKSCIFPKFITCCKNTCFFTFLLFIL